MGAARCLWAGGASAVTLAALYAPSLAPILHGASASGWLVLVWIAIASVPRAHRPGLRHEVLLTLAAFLPFTGYGVLVDVAAGRAANEIAFTLGVGLVLIAGLSAWVPRVEAQRWSWPATIWLFFLVCGPGLELALGCVTPQLTQPAALASLSNASPLRWALSRCAPEDALFTSRELGPIVALALAFALSRRFASSRLEASAST